MTKDDTAPYQAGSNIASPDTAATLTASLHNISANENRTAPAGFSLKGLAHFNLWNQPYLLLTLAACFWASNFVLGRAVPQEVVPVSLSFWRWVLALPIILPFAWPHLAKDWPEIKRKWPTILLLAGLGLAFSNTLAYVALRHTSATSALLVQSASPVLILLCCFLIFGDKPRKMQMVAMGFALIGVLSIILARPDASGGTFNIGTILACVAMMSQALYATLLRNKPKLHPASFLFATFAGAALLMLPFQLMIGTPLPLGNQTGMAALLYLAIGPSVVAFFIFNRGVALIGPGQASIFLYLMPVFGTIFAAIFLGEAIGLGEIAGFALVGIGFTLSRIRQG